MRSPCDTNRLWSRLLFLCVGLVLLGACAPARVPVKEEVPPSPELTRAVERLQEADRLVQLQAYQQALAIYEDHLKTFPQGPHADRALMNIGSVYMKLGSYARARQAFYRIIDEHPTSTLAADARFNIILTYYKEEKYAEAVKYATSALRYAATTHQQVRIYSLLGHSYGANKQFKEAVISYMDGYEVAPKQERQDVLDRVKAIIPSLNEPDLHMLIDKYGDRVPGGYLRLQLARVYDAEDRIDEALDTLSEFALRFPDHEESESAAAQAEELKARALVDQFSIGCILPLSGPYEAFGSRALAGIELALSEFNAQNPLTPIQLLIRDCRGDFSEAVLAVESLVLEDGVIGIIGPMVTSESAAMRAQSLQVPMITLTQKPDITKLGDYIFRNFLTPSLQVKAVVAYAVQELGIRRFAVLYPEERYGISFMNRFWDELILHGAEVVAIESYGPKQTDFADPIKKLVGLYYPRPENPLEKEIREEAEVAEDFLFSETEAGDPPPGTEPEESSPSEEEDEEPKPIVDFSAVFIPDSHKKVALIAPQFPYYDVNNVVLLGTNLWHSDELIKAARKYVQGAVVPDGFFPEDKSPGVRDFVLRFQSVFGTTPGLLEAQAYDAASILFHVMNDRAVRSRRGLRDALLEVVDFPGVTGPTSFDETGDVNKEICLLKIRGGGFVQIERLP